MQPYKAAPLPVYQRQYSESAYPTAAEQQTAIRTRNYSYQPREALTQHHYRDPAQSSVPRPQEKGRDNRNEEHGPERR